MKRLLFINACVRAESRTRRLAEELLSGWQGEICELNLEQMDLRPLTAETLARRDALLAAGDYADPAFEPARALVEADAVVLAAPYWDCSFPASVKVFVEQVMVNGLTFTFTADGVPHGKCRAKKLWYVSTAGGPVVEPVLGHPGGGAYPGRGPGSGRRGPRSHPFRCRRQPAAPVIDAPKPSPARSGRGKVAAVRQTDEGGPTTADLGRTCQLCRFPPEPSPARSKREGEGGCRKADG